MKTDREIDAAVNEVLGKGKKPAKKIPQETWDRWVSDAVHDFFTDAGYFKGSEDSAVQELMEQLQIDEGTAQRLLGEAADIALDEY